MIGELFIEESVGKQPFIKPNFHLFAVASHLLADAMTPQGIPLLWPSSQPFRLQIPGYRIYTGHRVDHWTGAVALSFCTLFSRVLL
ncbi:metal-dependent hydrolase [Salinithrix halophila]|uniref:Metal-dependent hydrolase n=1 Tax=Salinithrix halophila TaxID=1485204 RepID=A0ABV8JME2_9BACL